VIAFTPRGEAALDELATALTAHCSHTPDGIARVLDEVLHTPLADLADALTAIAAAAHTRDQARGRTRPRPADPPRRRARLGVARLTPARKRGLGA
jgi:hypothetical protein